MRHILLLMDPDTRRFNADLVSDLRVQHGEIWDQSTGLAHLLRTDFDAALAVLEERVDQEPVASARLSAIGDFVGNQQEHTQIVALLRRMHQRGLNTAFTVAHAVEVQLRVTPPSFIEQTGLIDLARDFLLGQDGSASSAIFHAMFPTQLDAAARWQRALLAELIDLVPNSDTAGMLIKRLGAVKPLWPAIAPRLDAMRKAMGDRPFASQLLMAASEDDAVAQQLLRWMQEQPGLFAHAAMTRFAASVAAGAAPEQAAWETLLTMVVDV